MSVLLSVKYFFPEIILTGFAVTVLILGLFLKRRVVLGSFCLLGILLHEKIGKLRELSPLWDMFKDGI